MTEASQYLIVLTTIILVLMVLTLVVIYIFFIRKKTELLIEQQDKELQFEKELSESLIEMKEQTLRHFGQELHDNIGQKLSVVRLRSNQVNSKLKNQLEDENLNNEMQDINLLLGECIQDMRNLAKTLIVNDIEEFDLKEMLELEIGKLKKLTFINLEVDNQLNGTEIIIDPKHSLIIFRIIQETLNNIYKHSKAKNINIQIHDDPYWYIFAIKDDGIGFDTDLQHKGRGLMNIKERAKMIQAQIKIKSVPQEGTQTLIKYSKS